MALANKQQDYYAESQKYFLENLIKSNTFYLSFTYHMNVHARALTYFSNHSTSDEFLIKSRGMLSSYQ